MLRPEDLKPVCYRKENKGELLSRETRFPCIAMLDANILGNEQIKIVVVKTDDDNRRTQINYQTFKEELGELSRELEMPLDITSEITLPHDESKDKQVALFKEIAEQFDENSEVYMDVTYGSKITSIGLFSALTFAERIMGCSIKSVIYGKYPHNDSKIGDLFDVRCLYELSMLINSADYMPKDSFFNLVDSLWGGKGDE